MFENSVEWRASTAKVTANSCFFPATRWWLSAVTGKGHREGGSPPRCDSEDYILPLDPELHLELPRGVFFRAPVLDSPKEFPRARC